MILIRTQRRGAAVTVALAAVLLTAGCVSGTVSHKLDPAGGATGCKEPKTWALVITTKDGSTAPVCVTPETAAQYTAGDAYPKAAK